MMACTVHHRAIIAGALICFVLNEQRQCDGLQVVSSGWSLQPRTTAAVSSSTFVCHTASSRQHRVVGCHRMISQQSQSLLYAKKTKSKKGKNGSGGGSSGVSGGFGKVATPPPPASKSKKQSQRPPSKSQARAARREQQDYSVFPKLEPQVAETLITSPPSLSEEADLLPLEIYDRLDQIYGFPNFNYEEKPTTTTAAANTQQEGDEDQAGDPMSITDLLSASPTTSTLASTASSSSASSKMSDTDFADLLAVATGGGGGGGSDTRTSSLTSTPSKILSTASPSPTGASDTLNEISDLPPFDRFRVLHVDPLVLAIDDFFTEEECDKYVEMSLSPNKVDNGHNEADDDNSTNSKVAALETKSKTVGKDAAAKSQRTSTTWFHHYERVPELMAKASRLIGLDGITHWEEPQTVRYRRNEKFTWHLDALSPVESTPEQGGQRTATLLVYLKEMSEGSGGATVFRDLTDGTVSDDGTGGGTLKVQPKKGSALLFFPAAGGIPNTPFDIRTLHCGEVVDPASESDKWIAQLWLRQQPYTPTAPPGNTHSSAADAISKYCKQA